MVLVVLGPAVMVLLAAGAGCLVKVWVDGGLQQLSAVDAVIAVAVVAVFLLFGYLSGLRLRGSRATTA